MNDRKKAVALIMIRLRERGVQPTQRLVKAVLKRLPLFGVYINKDNFTLTREVEDRITECVRQFITTDWPFVLREITRRPRRSVNKRRYKGERKWKVSPYQTIG